MIYGTIIRQYLGKEDHGILTGNLEIKYETGEIQGFGGYNLNDPSELHKWVHGLLKTFDISCLVQLENKVIKFKLENELIKEISPFGNDKWFRMN